MGHQEERMYGKAVVGGRGEQGGGWQSHICMRINQEDQLGSETDHSTQFSSTGN